MIAAALLLLGSGLWWVSDARGTTVRTDDTPTAGTPLPGPRTLPSSLTQLWRAPSGATPEPVVTGGTVITGHAGEVTGRDPVTGQARWSYRRELPLCTVGAAFGQALAVHREGEFCSEVTALAPADGSRGAQRTGPLRPPTRLLPEGNLVTATGQRYLEVWRSDLVRTLEYGALPTPVKPGAQPRTRCSYGSIAVAAGLLGVIERCPGERADRITVQQADPEEPDRPEIELSTLLRGRGASLVALTPDRSAVALPDPPRLVVLDNTGQRIVERGLDIPAADLRGDPPAGAVPTTVTAGATYWFTGSATVALGSPDLLPMWSIPDTLGPGTLLAGRLLVPVPGGLAVVDVTTGEQVGTLPVDRGGYTGPVEVGSAGDVVLEQRGDTLVALR
ncbi:MAG: hypothetical protein GEV09_15150 [Pseudonocardiaceae bacterium]|nr:hypothetical protein [Pseudonocardiaceae bacterium]